MLIVLHDCCMLLLLLLLLLLARLLARLLGQDDFNEQSSIHLPSQWITFTLLGGWGTPQSNPTGKINSLHEGHPSCVVHMRCPGHALPGRSTL